MRGAIRLIVSGPQFAGLTYLVDTTNGDIWEQDKINGIESWRRMPKIDTPDKPLDLTGLKPLSK